MGKHHASVRQHHRTAVGVSLGLSVIAVPALSGTASATTVRHATAPVTTQRVIDKVTTAAATPTTGSHAVALASLKAVAATPATGSLASLVTGVTKTTSNIRVSADANAKISDVAPAGTTISGTTVSGSSYLKITSPSKYAGKYVLSSALNTATTSPTKPVTPTKPTTPPVAATGTLKAPWACAARPTLSKGSSGDCVKVAQYILNSWVMRTNVKGGVMLAVDGSYGGSSTTDVKLFQTANNITATGVVDMKTWNALATASQATAATTVDGIKTDATHLAFPTAIKLTDGRLMVVFRSAAGHRTTPGMKAPKLYKIYSSDGGYTWTTPIEIVLPNGMTNQAAGLGIATSGPLKGRPILTTWTTAYDQTKGTNVGETHTYVTISNDLSGNTWGALTDVSAVKGSAWSASPIVQVDDTNFQQEVYVYGGGSGTSVETVPLVYNGTQFLAGHAAKVAMSGQVDSTVSYNEAGMIKLADGRLLSLVRDDNSTAGAQPYIWKSYSSDGGKTWTTPVKAFMGSGAPRMTLTTDGKVVVLYRHLVNHADGSSVDGDKDAVYRVSSDGGATWSAEQKAGVHSPFEMSYGQPIANPDGTVTFIYGSETTGSVSNIEVSANTKV